MEPIFGFNLNLYNFALFLLYSLENHFFNTFDLKSLNLIFLHPWFGDNRIKITGSREESVSVYKSHIAHLSI